MKHLLYLLLVVNLVYFSWNLLQGATTEDAMDGRLQLPPETRRLMTLEELQGFSGSIQADVFEVLTLEGSVAARDHIGGTAPAQVRAAIARAKRERANRVGLDYDHFTDGQLTDSWATGVFPNVQIGMHPEGVFLMRFMPHPTDPEKCIFDMWYLTLFPEGVSEYWSNSMRDWVSIDRGKVISID